MCEGDSASLNNNVVTFPQENNKETWFSGFFKICKRNFFSGDSASAEEMRKRITEEYRIKPSLKFVFAKYKDGFFRPANLIGRNNKLNLLLVNFYHNRKEFYVKPGDILVEHGNLLNLQVSFSRCGKEKFGKVYGNNSPSNRGFPSMFYIKRKEKWHRVPFKMVFLTLTQFNKAKNGKNSSDSKNKCNKSSVNFEFNSLMDIDGSINNYDDDDDDDHHQFDETCEENYEMA